MKIYAKIICDANILSWKLILLAKIKIKRKFLNQKTDFIKNKQTKIKTTTKQKKT